MKIKELKEAITDLDDEMEVVMSKDGEGNSYSPLADCDQDAIYISETTWYGEVYSTDWSAEDACMEDDEWEKFKASHKRCLVLAPVN